MGLLGFCSTQYIDFKSDKFGSEKFSERQIGVLIQCIFFYYFSIISVPISIASSDRIYKTLGKKVILRSNPFPWY